jgi:hypothetical protein
VFVRQTFVLPVFDGEAGIRDEREAIARAVIVELAGVPVPFATAEDLIIQKLLAGRATDLEDAATVVRRKGKTSSSRPARRPARADG